MAYDEPRFLGLRDDHFNVIVSTGTFTASGHVLTNTPVARHSMVAAAIVTGARACVTTAGVSASPTVQIASSAGVALSFGISHTLGAVAGTTTLTATRTLTAGEIPTVYIVHTGTASATQVTPILDVTLQFREQFS